MNFESPGPLALFAPLVMIFLVSLLMIWPTWRICAKTGNSGALALAFWIPLVNIIVFLYLAFSEWPIERELQQLRRSRQYQ